jgi:hypothetical protein
MLFREIGQLLGIAKRIKESRLEKAIGKPLGNRQ